MGDDALTSWGIDLVGAFPGPSILYRAVRDDRGEVVDLEALEVNDPAVAVSGLPREHFVGKRLDPAVRGSVPEFFERAVRAIATGETTELVTHAAVNQERYDWLQLRFVPCGELVLLFSRQARPADTAALVDPGVARRIVEALDDAIVSVDLTEERVVLASASLERLVGLRPAELMGQSWERVGALFSREDQDRLRAAFEDALRKHRAVAEVRLRRADGATRDLRISMSISFDELGDPVRLDGLWRDVTLERELSEKHRRSEALLRSVADRQTDFVARFRLDGTLTYSNPAVDNFFGGPAPPWLDFSALSNLAPEELARTIERLQNLTPDTPTISLDAPVRFRDGSIRWLQCSCRGLFDDEGRLAEVQVAARDVTERRARAERLEAAIAHNRKLLGALHHRVNNALQLASSLLRSELLDEPTPDLPARLRGVLDRVEGMTFVQATLDRAAREDRIDAAAFLGEIVDAVRASSSRPGVRVTASLEPVELALDQGLNCGLAAYELLDNALAHAFADRDGGQIAVTLRRAGEDIELHVRDDGVGARPEAMDERATSRGLVLLRQVTHWLGGRLAFEGGPGTSAALRFRPRPLVASAGADAK